MQQLYPTSKKSEHWTIESRKSFSVSTFKQIINARAKVRSPQANYLEHHGTFPGELRQFGAERKKRGREKRGRNEGEQETLT